MDSLSSKREELTPADHSPDLPGSFFSRGQWNAWCAAGADHEERKQRLEQVPEKWRADVKRHLQTVYAIKQFHKRKAEEKRNAKSKR